MYQEVLEKEIPRDRIKGYELLYILIAIDTIKEAYKRINISDPSPAVDYDDENNRYAYIYLYAGIHEAAICSTVRTIASEDPSRFKKMMKYDEDELRICSLGGGPGCDIFGMLRGRLLEKGPLEEVRRIHVCVVDLYGGWETTLDNAVETYAAVYEECDFEWLFLEADLCGTISSDVAHEVRTCDILNLVKFVSAVSNRYNTSPDILERIFHLMEPRSYVFFLDNSAGGFLEIVSRAARNVGLKSVLPPRITRYLLDSDTSTYNPSLGSQLTSMSVCFALWKKQKLPYTEPYNE